MILISDTNIIISCFYAPNGVIAHILTAKKQKIQFIAPSYLLEEVKEHLSKIMKDTHRSKKEALSFLKEITKNILFYEKKDISKKYGKKAE